MKTRKTHKAAAVALLQLGSGVHSALESAALRSGQTKSEFVRHAVQGAIQAQEGYWERLLIDVLRLVPELIEAASYAGLLTGEESLKITEPMDQARHRLYRVLDRIDGFPSVNWVPAKGEAVRSHQEVLRARATRDELLRPETEPLQRLTNRFNELHNPLRRREREKGKEKAKTARRKAQRPRAQSPHRERTGR
jgi:hypothetical protein